MDSLNQLKAKGFRIVALDVINGFLVAEKCGDYKYFLEINMPKSSVSYYVEISIIDIKNLIQ